MALVEASRLPWGARIDREFPLYSKLLVSSGRHLAYLSSTYQGSENAFVLAYTVHSGRFDKIRSVSRLALGAL